MQHIPGGWKMLEVRTRKVSGPKQVLFGVDFQGKSKGRILGLVEEWCWGKQRFSSSEAAHEKRTTSFCLCEKSRYG